MDKIERQIIRIDQIAPDPHNRCLAEDEELQGLTDSVLVLGILQPLHVRAMSEGKYELIDGERRWRAAKAAGLTEVPCEVWLEGRHGRDVLAAGVVLNEQRKAHGPVHVARRLREMKNSYGLGFEELAQRTGMPVDRVKSYLALFAGSDRLIEFFERQEVPLKVAVELVRYERATSEGRAKKLIERHMKEPLTKHQIAALRRKNEDPPRSAERKARLGIGRRVELAVARDSTGALAEITAALSKLGYEVLPARRARAAGAQGS